MTNNGYLSSKINQLQQKVLQIRAENEAYLRKIAQNNQSNSLCLAAIQQNNQIMGLIEINLEAISEMALNMEKNLVLVPVSKV